MHKYKLTYEFKDAGEYPTFQEAFKELYDRLTEDLKRGYSGRLLGAIFIEHEVDGVEGILGFFDARDLACNIGLLKDRKLQEVSLTPEDEVLIENTFVRGKIAATIEQIDMDAGIGQLRS